MNNHTYLLGAIFLMALVTYLPRVLPITILRKKIKLKFLLSFLNYMPYSVLSAMTFPAIFYSTGNLYTALIGTAVSLCLAYYKMGLIVVAFLSFVAVLISQVFI